MRTWWMAAAGIALSAWTSCGGEAPGPALVTADEDTGNEGGGSATGTSTAAAGASDPLPEGGAGAGGAPSRGCDVALICDDFEAGLDTTRWTVVEASGGTVSVDGSRPHSGTSSLHLELPAVQGAEAAVRISDVFPVVDNAFFGRAFVYVAPAVPTSHSKMLTARGDLAGERAEYRLDVNGGKLNSRYFTPTIDADIQHGGLRKMGDPLPTDAWLCLEWHYDGAANTMVYWIDGQELAAMTVDGSESPSWVAPPFERFDLGFKLYHEDAAVPTLDVWYDDVALSPERVGCG